MRFCVRSVLCHRRRVLRLYLTGRAFVTQAFTVDLGYRTSATFRCVRMRCASFSMNLELIAHVERMRSAFLYCKHAPFRLSLGSSSPCLSHDTLTLTCRLHFDAELEVRGGMIGGETVVIGTTLNLKTINSWFSNQLGKIISKSLVVSFLFSCSAVP